MAELLIELEEEEWARQWIVERLQAPDDSGKGGIGDDESKWRRRRAGLLIMVVICLGVGPDRKRIMDQGGSIGGEKRIPLGWVDGFCEGAGQGVVTAAAYASGTSTSDIAGLQHGYARIPTRS